MKRLKILTITLVLILCAGFCIIPAQAARIAGDGGFYYSLKSNKTAILEEYSGTSENVVIPSEVYSYTVTAIADSIFSNNGTIKTVVIPDTISSIGEFAFYGCPNLESVQISSSVTSIKAATFYECLKLTKVIIPASVVHIADNAFIGCDDLTIVGEVGSYAETYAQEHGITFSDIAAQPDPSKIVVFGDADGDKKISSYDSLIVLRYSVDLEDFDDKQKYVSDIDKDGSIDSFDSLMILRYSVGLDVSEYNIGNEIVIP